MDFSEIRSPFVNPIPFHIKLTYLDIEARVNFVSSCSLEIEWAAIWHPGDTPWRKLKMTILFHAR